MFELCNASGLHPLKTQDTFSGNDTLRRSSTAAVALKSGLSWTVARARLSAQPPAGRKIGATKSVEFEASTTVELDSPTLCGGPSSVSKTRHQNCPSHMYCSVCTAIVVLVCLRDGCVHTTPVQHDCGVSVAFGLCTAASANRNGLFVQRLIR